MQTVCVLCGESMASAVDYEHHLELRHGLVSDFPTDDDEPVDGEPFDEPVDGEPVDDEPLERNRLEPAPVEPAEPAPQRSPPPGDTATPPADSTPKAARPVREHQSRGQRGPSTAHSGVSLIAAFTALMIGIGAGMLAQRAVSPNRAAIEGDLVVATDPASTDNGFVLESLTVFPAPDGAVAATATVANIAPEARSAQWEIELYAGDMPVGTLRAEGIAVGPNQRVVTGFLGPEGMTAVPDHAVLRTLFVT